MKKDFQMMNEEEIFDFLKTNNDGLTELEASKRLEQYGLNELPKKEKDSIFKLFFMQFANSITIIMIVACILSFMINEVTDAIAIIVSEETGRVSIGVNGELNYNLTLDDVRMMLISELQPKKETFYDADDEIIDEEMINLESEGEIDETK